MFLSLIFANFIAAIPLLLAPEKGCQQRVSAREGVSHLIPCLRGFALYYSIGDIARDWIANREMAGH